MEKLGLEGNYKVIPNVVDTAVFKPKNSRENTISLIHISGMLDVHKNISGMLKAAKLLENEMGHFTWFFVGGSAAPYQKLIDSLHFTKASIIFKPHMNHQKLVSLLQSANALISYSHYETFGITLLEAIACGTPIIATKTGVVYDLQHQEFCTVTPFNNDKQLALNIKNSLKIKQHINPKKMHQFVAKNYDKKVVASAFSLLYYKTLAL